MRKTEEDKNWEADADQLVARHRRLVRKLGSACVDEMIDTDDHIRERTNALIIAASNLLVADAITSAQHRREMGY